LAQAVYASYFCGPTSLAARGPTDRAWDGNGSSTQRTRARAATPNPGAQIGFAVHVDVPPIALIGNGAAAMACIGRPRHPFPKWRYPHVQGDTQPSEWANGPPKIVPGTQGSTVGKVKGKAQPVQSATGSKQEPNLPTAPLGAPGASSETANTQTLAALKAALESAQATNLFQGPENGPLLQAMQHFVSALTTKIAATEPLPKEKPLHAQAQALQWKINTRPSRSIR